MFRYDVSQLTDNTRLITVLEELLYLLKSKEDSDQRYYSSRQRRLQRLMSYCWYHHWHGDKYIYVSPD